MKFHPKGVEVVLGAGGAKGPGHTGVLKAIEELKIPVSKVTGVSVGSLVAALYANGLSPEQIFQELVQGLKNRKDPTLLLKALTPADPFSLIVGGPIDLIPAMREMVARLNLEARDELKIVACDILRHEPVVFEGSQYDLAKALTASCALPTVLRPVWHQDGMTPRLLVDGAVYHYNPTDFCQDTAIVSSFKPATEFPREFETVFDLYFHMREMYAPIAGHRRYVDPHKHVVLEIGLADVAGLNFGISVEKARAMEEDGYQTAMKMLKEAIAAGRIHTEESLAAALSASATSA